MVDDSITGNLRAYGSARMSAPPEANTEYSTGSGAFQPLLAPTSAAFGQRREGIAGAAAAENFLLIPVLAGDDGPLLREDDPAAQAR